MTIMASPCKRVLIAGYFGFGNTGDEAILAGMLRDLALIRSDLNFIIVSGNPEQTAARYKVESLLWTDLPRILEAAENCDLIILGGGGIFLDYWGAQSGTLLTKDHSGNSYFAGFPLLAALNRKPCMLYSVGVGPLLSEEGKSLTRLAFGAATAVTVRDNESLELLKAIGVNTDQIRVTADPAYSLPADDRRAKEILAAVGTRPDTALIGVCVRAWDVDVSPNYWQEQVAAALDSFSETHDVSIIFIPFQVLPGAGLTNDLLPIEAIRALMRARASTKVISGELLPGEIAGILGQCDLVIGMRLHSLLFALRESVPAVGLVYDPKVNSLMSRAGMQEYAIDLQTLTSERLSEMIDRAWSGRAELAGRLKASAEASREFALENARLATGLLDQKVVVSDAIEAFIKNFSLKQTRLLAEQTDVLIERNGLLVERTSLLVERTAQLAERDGLLVERNAILDERNRRLEESHRVLAERAELLAGQQNRLAEQASRIQEQEIRL